MNATVPEASQQWKKTKGTYRLWDNESVTADKQIQYHFETHVRPQLGSRADCQRILQISDTVELDYTGKRSDERLGPLSYEHQRGLRLHNSLLLNSLGCPLGLLRQSYHIREDEFFGKSRERVKLPFQEKESYRWSEHFQAGQELCRRHPGLEVVYVADREADIMELFLERKEPNMHFVIRSRYDRKLADGRQNLAQHVNAWSSQGLYSARVFDEKAKKWRSAQLEVRFGEVGIKLHKAAPAKKHLPPVRLFVVDVTETTPGTGKGRRIHWRLFTTLPVHAMQDALLALQYYLFRWLIERFHFLLKSGGANVEDLQLETPKRLKNAITNYSIVAMEAFKLRYLAEKSPNEPILDVGITQLEYQVLYTYAQENVKLKVTYDPLNPPSVKEYCTVLGQIAGFFPSKRQPLPGLKIISRALEKLQLLTDAYLIFCQRT
jgi:hypothetical protein